ncbi:MAG: hypothetical protein JWO15_3739 [Sphingomonadales bacterium]|nr:hypothetical protein [Sphingomonadales bacterium]
MAVHAIGRPTFLTDDEVWVEVVAALGVRPISDPAAATIARMWWPDDGNLSDPFVELGVAGQLHVEGLLAAIDSTLAELTDLTHEPRLCLDALATWARAKDAS